MSLSLADEITSSIVSHMVESSRGQTATRPLDYLTMDYAISREYPQWQYLQ